MTGDLERRYSRLLGLYPADYRRVRGPELLETLLESASDGQRRPAPREAVALILGALRARAGRDRRQPVSLSWLAACRAAALMLLVYAVAWPLARLLVDLTLTWSSAIPSSPPWIGLEGANLAALAPGLVALVLALRGRHLGAAVAAAVALAAGLVTAWSAHLPLYGDFWEFPLAIVLLLVLARRAPGPAAGVLRYAPLAPLVLIAVNQFAGQALQDIAGIVQFGASIGLYAAALLWLAVDERVTMAVGLLTLNTFLAQVVLLVTGPPALGWTVAAVSVATEALPPTVLLLIAATTTRRRARL